MPLVPEKELPKKIKTTKLGMVIPATWKVETKQS
jgi:hypothetical protein